MNGRAAAQRGRAVKRAFGKLRGAGWALFDQCVVSGANFLTIYLFARYLDAVHFGAFMLAHTGLLLLTNLQQALLVHPHNVLAAPLARPDYQRFTGALVLAQLSFCAGVCAVLGASGWLVARAYSPKAGGVLLALAIAAVPWMGQEFTRRVLYTRGESRAATINDAVTYGLQLMGAVALVGAWRDLASPQAALYVLGGSSLVGVLIGLWQLRDHVRIDGRGMPASCTRTLAEVWNFGRWLIAQNAVAWFGAQGHSWVVAFLLGAEQVGIYRAATHLINLMNPVFQACCTYLPARGSLAYHAGGAAGLSQWVRRSLWMMAVALLPFGVVLAGFPGQVLDLAYGEKFTGTNLALILALGTVSQFIGFWKYPFDLGLLALRSTKSIFYAYLIPVVLLLTSGAALIHFLGILGVPLSGIVIHSAVLIATWLAYRKRVKENAAI
jgi:O-antigen/teichoic acid export membrane protein